MNVNGRHAIWIGFSIWVVLAGCAGKGKIDPGPGSVEGPWLAFTVLEGKKRDIYIVSRDGSFVRNITRGRGKNV